MWISNETGSCMDVCAEMRVREDNHASEELWGLEGASNR